MSKGAGRATSPATAAKAVESVRQFNRFYTRRIGVLDEGLLSSPYSLTEARLLYELAHREGVAASELCRELDIDAGYLSRLLKRFQARGLLERKRSADDARQSVLRLTAKGQLEFAPLDEASRAQVSALLGALQPSEVGRLTEAMRTIEQILGARAASTARIVLRAPRVGDIGWIVHRHGVLYASEYGWDQSFEALVAEICAGFTKNFDPQRERCWVADRDGRIVGSVFLVRGSAKTAKLRLLYVEPDARGLGVGRRLTEECIRCAREMGYKTLTLWTNDVLVSARRIYEAAGFRLVNEERHHSFGKDLVGQHWSLAL